MRVLSQGDVEVWIFPFDPPKHVRCFVKGFEVVIDLNMPQTVQGYDSDLPSPGVLGKAMRTIAAHLPELIQKWDEVNF